MYDFLIKTIVVGDSGIGKTCLTQRFVDDKYNANDITIGVEFGSKIISHEDKKIKIQIWDTAGQEAFRSIVRSYYRNAAGVILCYDITNEESFRNIKTWLEDVITNCNNSPQIILVGTKCDLEHRRAISKEYGETFAKTHNMLFVETSAKNAYGITECFQMLAAKIYNEILSGNSTNWQTGIVQFPEDHASKKRSCC